MTAFTESVVEEAALAWLEALGYAVLHGPEIAAGEPAAERSDPNYRDVVLERRLREALARLNPDLPPEALDDAYRKLTRGPAPSLIERNRARPPDAGRRRHGRVPPRRTARSPARRRGSSTSTRPDNNDWLAVNQFTVVGGPAHAPAGHRAVRQRPAARR